MNLQMQLHVNELQNMIIFCGYIFDYLDFISIVLIVFYFLPFRLNVDFLASLLSLSVTRPDSLSSWQSSRI